MNAAVDTVDPQGVCAGAPECQVDTCDGAGGCGTSNAVDGTPCSDDGQFCTGIEECGAGVCAGTGDPCPGTECNTCDEAANNCFTTIVPNIRWLSIAAAK